MKERAPDFDGFAGLQQKRYLQDATSGEYAGLYLRESPDALAAVRDSELRASSAQVHRAEGEPRVEVYRGMEDLRPAGPRGTPMRPAATCSWVAEAGGRARTRSAFVDTTASVFLSCVLVSSAALGQAVGAIRSTLQTVELPAGRIETVYASDLHFEAPNWSPDGLFFVVNSEGRLYRLPTSGDQRLEEIPTGFATRVNNDHGFSPDGSRIALSHHADEHITDPTQDWLASSIFIIPSQGTSSPVKVTTQAPSFWHGWSPDGGTLVFVGLRAGEWDIYTIPATGGEERRLTTCPGLDDGPDYTPDGELIYYNSFCSGKMEIWRMRSDGGDAQQLTDDDYANWFPHPSPDGQWVVFLAYLEDQGEDHPFGKQVKLRLMSTRDGSVRDLTPPFFGGQGTINVPSWSPDSRHVAFVTFERRQ